MLALWEYFWNTSDWVASSNLATAITLSGPSGGIIDAASSPFTVGANGSISGTLVVTFTNTGGTGILSQTVFSLSTGAATGLFTYTPSTLGTHLLAETNSQGLTDTSLSYVVIPVPINQSTGGARRDDYKPIPDDFWEVRERYLRRYVEPVVLRTTKELPAAVELAVVNQEEQIVTAELAILSEKRDNALLRARASRNADELRTYALRVIQLTIDLEQEQIAAQNMRAALILLLDI